MLHVRVAGYLDITLPFGAIGDEVVEGRGRRRRGRLGGGPCNPVEGCLVVGREPAEGAKRTAPGRHDVIAATTLSSTHALVFAITSEGRAMALRAADIAEVGGRSRGTAGDKLFGTYKPPPNASRRH
mgnify:CR=1 FL=1